MKVHGLKVKPILGSDSLLEGMKRSAEALSPEGCSVELELRDLTEKALRGGAIVSRKQDRTIPPSALMLMVCTFDGDLLTSVGDAFSRAYEMNDQPEFFTMLQGCKVSMNADIAFSAEGREIIDAHNEKIERDLNQDTA